jgi:hypothetical protein
LVTVAGQSESDGRFGLDGRSSQRCNAPMTADELTDLLQAVHKDAEVRVALPGAEPVAYRIAAVTKSSEGGKPVGWLILEPDGGPARKEIFELQRRIR